MKSRVQYDKCGFCGMDPPDHPGRNCPMKTNVKYNKCFFCGMDPPDHPGRDCPMKPDSNPDRFASRSPPRRRRDWATCRDMPKNPERHDFYFKWSDICACFDQNLCTALRHSCQRKCVLELDGTTICFIASNDYRRLLCDWIRAGRPHLTG